MFLYHNYNALFFRKRQFLVFPALLEKMLGQRRALGVRVDSQRNVIGLNNQQIGVEITFLSKNNAMAFFRSSSRL